MDTGLSRPSDVALLRHASLGQFPRFLYDPSTLVNRITVAPSNFTMGMATADDSDSDNEYDDFRTKLGSPTTPVNGSSSSSSGSGKITQYTLNTDELGAQQKDCIVELSSVPTSTHTSYLYDSLAETHKLKYKPKIFWFDENTVLLQLQTAEDAHNIVIKWSHSVIQAKKVKMTIKPARKPSPSTSVAPTITTTEAPLSPASSSSSATPLQQASPIGRGRGRGTAAVVLSPNAPGVTVGILTPPTQSRETTPVKPVAPVALEDSKETDLAAKPRYQGSPDRPQTVATVARNTIMRMLDMSLSPEQKERDKEDKAILKEASAAKKAAQAAAKAEVNSKPVEPTPVEAVAEPAPASPKVEAKSKLKADAAPFIPTTTAPKINKVETPKDVKIVPLRLQRPATGAQPYNPIIIPSSAPVQATPTFLAQPSNIAPPAFLIPQPAGLVPAAPKKVLDIAATAEDDVQKIAKDTKPTLPWGQGY